MLSPKAVPKIRSAESEQLEEGRLKFSDSYLAVREVTRKFLFKDTYKIISATYAAFARSQTQTPPPSAATQTYTFSELLFSLLT